jgi:hypothetical protein
MIWLNVLIGLLLLFSGRIFFWLFVACIGFASFYYGVQQYWAIHSPILVLILSIVAGAVGAIIAIFLRKVAIVFAGFAAGGYIALNIFDQFVGLSSQMSWMPYVIGGIIGAIILFFIFDWALIFLSSLAGAGLIVQVLAFKPWVEIALFLVLIIVGMAFQAKIMTSERSKQ